MIPATIILVLGLGIILFGLQIMFMPSQRKIPTQVIKSTIMVVGGMYLVFFLSQQFSSAGNSGGLPPGFH